MIGVMGAAVPLACARQPASERAPAAASSHAASAAEIDGATSEGRAGGAADDDASDVNSLARAGASAGAASAIALQTTAAASAASSIAAPDPANKVRPPPTSPDLDERAAHLLDAIARDDPGAADDFFFPKAPFIPLKDVADPGRYFDQLLATYHRDIRSIRAERKDWTGAAFVSFELGTPPTWVAPGKEYNKIGYFRTFGGKLRYRVGDKTKELAVSTIISWDGRWYVTHLSPIRH